MAHWRVPRKEEFPQPRSNKVVSFLTFHEHGLGYTAHWFLRGLLNESGLELQHLNPTGVLHIAGFVTVYEAFLGMEPHVDLFRHFFSGRAMTAGNSAETAPVGGGSPCRGSRAQEVCIPRTPHVTPTGDGMGSGSILGIRRRHHFQRSPAGGRRSRKVGRGVAPARRGTRWRSSRRSCGSS